MVFPWLAVGGPLLDDCLFTLENHCTRTALSSRGGCSREVHKIVYLAVKKPNIKWSVVMGVTLGTPKFKPEKNLIRRTQR